MASTHTRTTRTALLAVIAASALVVSACGSSSSTTPSAGSSSTTSAAAPSGVASSSTPAASSAAAPSSSAPVSSAPASSAASSPVASSGAAPADLTAADITAAKASLADPTTLTVCTSLPYPPFEGDDGSGKIVGFDIDFMDFIAKKLGIGTKVVDNPFEGIQSGQAMTSKTCDIGAAAMTINAERKKAILFSDPYYDASQALMVLSDSTVKTLADLKGKKLGAQTGTTGYKYAQDHAAESGYTIVEVASVADEEQGLQSNTLDAVIQDQPALNDYVKAQKGTVKIVANFNTGEQYGFGMALGNTALAKVANYAIAAAKADGSYEASYKKWIDSTS